MKTATEAIECQKQIDKLEMQMDAAQANPAAWKRTLGCPGTRFLPEWEKLMSKINTFLKYAPQKEINIYLDFCEARLTETTTS